MDEVSNLYLAIGRGASVPRAQVKDRPYFDVALFWGDTQWEPYVREKRLDSLRPEQGNQFGRFYPAFNGEEAVIDLVVNGQAGPWPATEEALAIFARHGIPTALRAEPRDDARWPWVVGGLAGAASLLLLGGVVAFRRRSRAALL